MGRHNIFYLQQTNTDCADRSILNLGPFRAMKKGLKRLSGSMMQTWFSNKTTWLKFRCPKLSQIFPKVYIICTVWKPRKFELFWTNQFWWLVLWDDLSLFPHTFRWVFPLTSTHPWSAWKLTLEFWIFLGLAHRACPYEPSTVRQSVSQWQKFSYFLSLVFFWFFASS